ncbi:MAG: DNA polymerase I [Nitrospina sp.]|nr:MAG: DNA polymerase I [Nitrospina sp.]
MSKKEKLYLIDGSSYIFRAFYGIKQFLSNSDGLPTNALYGFTTMLIKVVREEAPDYLAVVFDSKEPTFRHKMFPEYKANRDTPPEELAEQFPYFEPLVKAFNIVSLRKPGFEADDIIGTLAGQGEAAGLAVTIVSGDKDMMQLITPMVHMLDTMKGKRFEEPDVVEKFGVLPDKVIEVMGLMGDASDNIPGVKGVGPKTATELIQKYSSIAELYERVDEVEKKKLHEKLVQDKEQALLSRELVTIDRQVPLDCKIEDLKVRAADPTALKKMFTQLDFSRLLEKLESAPAVGEAPSPNAPSEGTEMAPEKSAPVQPVETHYETVLDEKSLDRWIKKLKSAGQFAVDLETTSKHPMQAAMVGISFSCETGEAAYLPVAHNYLGVPEQLDKKLALAKLKPLLEDAQITKCGQNIKYDLIVFASEGVQLAGIEFDSMLASYVLNPSKRNHNMDDLAMEYLGRKTIHYDEVAGKGAKQIGFDEVAIEPATEYAAEDADVTWQLTQTLRALLDAEAAALYREIELPLIEVLADMEMAGVKIDVKHLAKLSRQIDQDLKKLEGEIHALAGEPFNINSPKQLSVILFEKLQLRVIKKTKTGYSTDVNVLEALADEHALPEKILSFRQLAKLKSTYVNALPLAVNKKTGRVHTSYNQTVAATGRLSSSDPNLQNIPIRSELGKEIRKAFIAEGEGVLLLSADYSQIELRILAHLSEDPALTRAFKKGEDIHTRTAAEIFGQALDAVDEEGRRMAKAVNFGIVYGLSAFGLSRQLKISPKDAKIFIDQYFDLYKNVKTFMESTIEDARRKGYTTTLMNRRRYLPDLNSKNRQVREAAERVAINSPVQGSAADLIKLAMIRLHEKIRGNKLKSKMIMQVHDELVFEYPRNEEEILKSLVRHEMEEGFPLKVPVVVHMATGKNWNEAH